MVTQSMTLKALISSNQFLAPFGGEYIQATSDLGGDP